MFVTIVFNEVRPKVKCIHTKMIIVCSKLRAVKKRDRLLVVYACCVWCGSKKSKMSYFD